MAVGRVAKLVGIADGAGVDALSEFGVRHIDMPLTPEKVWRAIRG